MTLPFRTWLYRPNYLPRGLAIEMAEGTTLQEPELCSLLFVRESGKRATEPTQHAVPFRRLRRVSAGVGSVAALSGASRVVQQLGLVSYFESVHAVLELEFEGSEEMRLDLQPTLPLLWRSLVFLCRKSAPELGSLKGLPLVQLECLAERVPWVLAEK